MDLKALDSALERLDLEPLKKLPGVWRLFAAKGEIPRPGGSALIEGKRSRARDRELRRYSTSDRDRQAADALRSVGLHVHDRDAAARELGGYLR